MYATGQSVRPDLFRSNCQITHSLQQEEQVSEVLYEYNKHCILVVRRELMIRIIIYNSARWGP